MYRELDREVRCSYIDAFRIGVKDADSPKVTGMKPVNIYNRFLYIRQFQRLIGCVFLGLGGVLGILLAMDFTELTDLTRLVAALLILHCGAAADFIRDFNRGFLRLRGLFGMIIVMIIDISDGIDDSGRFLLGIDEEGIDSGLRGGSGNRFHISDDILLEIFNRDIVMGGNIFTEFLEDLAGGCGNTIVHLGGEGMNEGIEHIGLEGIHD